MKNIIDQSILNFKENSDEVDKFIDTNFLTSTKPQILLIKI